MTKNLSHRVKINKPAIIFIAVASLLVIALGIAASWQIYDKNAVDDMPGNVIGPNRRNIPESQLPQCETDGIGHMVQTPCYSPPDVNGYL